MSSKQTALLAPVRQSFSASIEGKPDELDDSGSDWAKLVAKSAAQKIASKKKSFERFEANINTVVLSFVCTDSSQKMIVLQLIQRLTVIIARWLARFQPTFLSWEMCNYSTYDSSKP
jgi:hypothetical protein